MGNPGSATGTSSVFFTINHGTFCVILCQSFMAQFPRIKVDIIDDWTGILASMIRAMTDASDIP